jgi:hypothetical protein
MFKNLNRSPIDTKILPRRKISVAIAAAMVKTLAKASCPPMDYTLVSGRQGDIQKFSPVVAFRLDPSTNPGYGDALVATKEDGLTYLTYYGQSSC